MANTRVTIDNKGRATYTASVAGQATTAAIVLSIEASATRQLKITTIKVGASPATAPAAVTVTVQRRTTASSGGTLISNEANGNSVSRHNPDSPVFPGVVRLGGTPGAAGAIVDQVGFVVGAIASQGLAPFIIPYGEDGEEPIIIPAGVANGVTINISAAGAGGLADGSISVTMIVE